MSRRDDQDRKERRRNSPNRERDEEQEVELEEGQEKKKEAESEHSRQQNQLGNQGVQALLAAQGAGAKGQGTGKGGVESEQIRKKKAHEKEGQDYGGEADPADAPLTEWDLVRDWNPVTTSPSDRTAFHEPMPDSQLPDEDAALRARLPPLAAEPTEGDLQPTVTAVIGAFSGWSRGVSRWATLGPTWPAVAFVARRSAPLLQDPGGRVLLLRSRTAALSTLALGAYRFPPTSRPWLRSLLEIEARDGHVREAARKLGKPDELPTAVKLFDALVPAPQDDTEVAPEPVELPPGPLAAWLTVVEHLAALEDPSGLVPQLVAPSEDEDDPDDFLGLDALMAEMTGGPKDRAEPVFRTAIQAAEKLAGATTLTRVRAAGLAALLHEAAGELGGPTRAAWRALVDVADKETQRVLQLLLEVARAAQKRTVPPPGLQNGLRRSATALQRARRAITTRSGQLWATAVHAPPELGFDPEAGAPWVTGDLEALAALPRDAVGELFYSLTRVVDAEAMLPKLDAARRAATDGRIAAALGVALGAVALRLDQIDLVDRLAASQADIARRAGNGVLLADAALLAIEAALRRGDLPRIDQIKAGAASELARRGQPAGLTLVLRWGPPAEELGDTEPTD